MTHALWLHNTLGRKKERFIPIDPEHVRMYACGPTVYNYAHIGNARAAVTFDLLARLLRSLYPKVTYVSNITDIDDRIMAAARESSEPIQSITRKFEAVYNQDMQALGCNLPDRQPRATEHIPEMIALIQKLLDKGHAYTTAETDSAHVLFHVPSFPAYGGLSGRSRDDQIAGARVEVAPYKKDPADFVLWKPSTDDQPGWDSPWGFGRPGWHIECSAMSEKHLGFPFDIHGGGLDLTFPHHENELAQSCCAHAGSSQDLQAFARYWVHNGFVMVEGQKMSKSLGNVLLAHELAQKTPGEALRWALLSTHYRQPLDWTEENLRRATSTLTRLYQALYEMDFSCESSEEQCEIPGEVLKPLCDDMNTPLALAGLQSLLKQATEMTSGPERVRILNNVRSAGMLLGFLRHPPSHWLGYGQNSKGREGLASEEIERLIDERTAARKNKDFQRSDKIRNDLAAQGIAIEDTPQGTRWKREQKA